MRRSALDTIFWATTRTSPSAKENPSFSAALTMSAGRFSPGSPRGIPGRARKVMSHWVVAVTGWLLASRGHGEGSARVGVGEKPTNEACGAVVADLPFRTE